MTEDRLVTSVRVDEDAQYEAGLRPRTLDEYIGQERVRENLHVSITAAKQRGEQGGLASTVGSRDSTGRSVRSSTDSSTGRAGLTTW